MGEKSTCLFLLSRSHWYGKNCDTDDPFEDQYLAPIAFLRNATLASETVEWISFCVDFLESSSHLQTVKEQNWHYHISPSCSHATWSPYVNYRSLSTREWESESFTSHPLRYSWMEQHKWRLRSNYNDLFANKRSCESKQLSRSIPSIYKLPLWKLHRNNTTYPTSILINFSITVYISSISITSWKPRSNSTVNTSAYLLRYVKWRKQSIGQTCSRMNPRTSQERRLVWRWPRAFRWLARGAVLIHLRQRFRKYGNHWWKRLIGLRASWEAGLVDDDGRWIDKNGVKEISGRMIEMQNKSAEQTLGNQIELKYGNWKRRMATV